MKVIYTVPNGRLAFEFDVATGKLAFQAVAAIQEVFEEECCGACKSKRIRMEVREFDSNVYHKYLCMDCGATLDLGQNKDGKGLFIKRFDKDSKQPLADGGWYVYHKSSF